MKETKGKKTPAAQASGQDQTIKTKPIMPTLQDNLELIRSQLGNSSDIVIRELSFPGGDGLVLAVVYTDGLADKQSVSEFILESAMLGLAGKGRMRY